ncbi:chemotaxis protein CheD [Sorangium atrum]|uniref:Probable chemoreceptor glutamine deamidase CheD n=1 Tax=Sorangium atrum TaxID=2995308 RepID=A0ABT5CEM2_9BACT|nr:chemotaxis protein CheD [Sorangium aterium]MDC0684860.1 chemotaxis protein CheD [Sorangium aterium]
MTMLKPPSQRFGAGGARLSVPPPSSPLAHYLTPGNIFASDEPTIITTIVGSCVSICLWEPALGVGGMNHYVLPSCPNLGLALGRFGDTAFQQLVDRLAAFGATPRSLQARIVGGACMISAFRERDSHLGHQNVAVGLMMLRAAGIRVIHQDTGGSQGRKLIFRTDDGSAAIQPL